MELSGDWITGGVLELYADGERFDCIAVSAAPFSVLASLFLAAIHSQSTHWFNAYVTTKALVQVLDDQGVLSMPVSGSIYKLINKLRSQLAKTAIHKFIDDSARSKRDWVTHLLQSAKGPGYRIALPPTSLKLFIGGKQVAPNGPDRLRR